MGVKYLADTCHQSGQTAPQAAQLGNTKHRAFKKKRSSWEIQNTLPDLPGDGSSLSALSPATSRQQGFKLRQRGPDWIVLGMNDGANLVRATTNDAGSGRPSGLHTLTRLPSYSKSPVMRTYGPRAEVQVLAEEGARTADGHHVVSGIDGEDLAQLPERHGHVVLEREVAAGMRRRLLRPLPREVQLLLQEFPPAKGLITGRIRRKVDRLLGTKLAMPNEPRCDTHLLDNLHIKRLVTLTLDVSCGTAHS